MQKFKISEIASLFNTENIIGDYHLQVEEIISLDMLNNALNQNTSMLWIADKYATTEVLKLLANIGFLICSPKTYHSLPSKPTTVLIVDNPRLAFLKLLKHISFKDTATVAHTAQIDKRAILGENVSIGHHVVIEEGVIVGENTKIGHNTVIYKNTKIGKAVVIGSNCTIGAEGFGYEKNEIGNFEHIPHAGNVVIEDYVFIHNNSCIDRAVIGSTVIGENTKIDNLVHIAHGVKIGKNSLIIANSMVGGSTKIGDNSWLAPSSSILNKLSIGNDSIVGMGAVVLKDVIENTTVVGNPAKPHGLNNPTN
jgi:UDP-3-O-[3-hydroxymyristoyl] glucosamine N-acyltransferase